VYTLPTAINASGAITGWDNAPPQANGFVRATNGAITSFRVSNDQTTRATTINSLGTIAGYSIDKQGAFSGFVRSVDGTIRSFTVPGNIYCEEQADFYCAAVSINDAGVITGSYTSGQASHGFVRAVNGVVTTFDPAGSVTTYSTEQHCHQCRRNHRRVLRDANLTPHGFERAVDGTIVTFDAQGTNGFGTYAYSINDLGVIAGSYEDEYDTHHGFLRAVDGATTRFDAPYVGRSLPVGTYALSLNAAGTITGFFNDLFNDGGNCCFARGFERSPDANIGSFEAPDSLPGFSTYGATWAHAINAAGIIVGTYMTIESCEPAPCSPPIIAHGFLVMP
jgi:hypothetical protein